MTPLPDPRDTVPAQAGHFDRLRRLVASEEVDTVLLAVPDMQGRLKGKRYSAEHFVNSVVTNGAEMCAYILGTDVDMRPLDGFPLASWDTGYGDMALRPDPDTVRLLPWIPGAALVLADAVGHDGQPVQVAPRQMLRRQLDQLAARGIHARSGLETEFLLFQGTYADAEQSGYRGLRPVATDNLDYALDHPAVMDRFFHELQAALDDAGRPVEAIKTESAPGQIEVTFPHGDPMEAADTHLLLKHAVRRLGERAGLAPTFMAAPASGIGSGCHVHLSLWREEAPLFAETEGRMPDMARHVIAGLLDALPHLAPLYAPTINSYKRYQPGTFAPANFTWGRDNRTCAIRIIGHGDSLHLEVRLPGADTNPYLALAAVLAAAQHGLDHKLDPPHPCIGNAYQSTNAPSVPATLHEALADFCDNQVASELLTTGVVKHYAHAADIEVKQHHRAITDAELRRWFARA